MNLIFIMNKLKLTESSSSKWQFSEFYLNLVTIIYIALRLFSLSVLVIFSLQCKLNIIFSSMSFMLQYRKQYS